MIDMTQATLAIMNLFLLTIAYYFIFSWIPAVRIAEFRQSMFDLRDKMFDAAERGELSFNDEAYGELRLMMNGFIRVAEHFSIFDLAASLVLWRDEKNLEDGEGFSIEGAISEAPLARRKLYGQYSEEMHLQFFMFVCRRSVVIYTFIRVIQVVVDLIGAVMRLTSVKRWLRLADQEAYNEGAATYYCRT